MSDVILEVIADVSLEEGRAVTHRETVNRLENIAGCACRVWNINFDLILLYQRVIARDKSVGQRRPREESDREDSNGVSRAMRYSSGERIYFFDALDLAVVGIDFAM